MGDLFSSDNIWVKRPGNGKISAEKYDKVIGMIAKNDIKVDKQISPEDIVDYR